jgi:hypothetical protein
MMRGYGFLGEQYYAKREYAKAAETMTRLIDLKPKQGMENALFARAVSNFHLRRHSAVVTDLDVLIPDRERAKDPKYAAALGMRCVAKVLGNRDSCAAPDAKQKEIILSAEKDCAAAKKLDPNNGFVREYGPDLDDCLQELKTGKKLDFAFPDEDD